MVEPIIKKYPTEIFGYPYTDTSKEAKEARRLQYCPFLKTECKKPRKSNPSIKVGTCTVGYKGKSLSKFEPVIICPNRFVERNVFQKLEQDLYPELPKNYKIKWVNEVTLGVGGTIDYVMCKMKEDGSIHTMTDFTCIEFQSSGTTGTPWDGVVDIQKYGKFRKESYKYGINWANEFVKTMMQQVYKKGLIIESWKKEIVFVVQDVCMKYLQQSCDTSGIKDYNKTMPIHFFTYKIVWDDKRNKWILKDDQKFSSNTDGIRKILSGSSIDLYPTMEDFKQNILRKMSKTKS